MGPGQLARATPHSEDMFDWLEQRRRRRILERPFPEAWRSILRRNMRHFSYLDATEVAQEVHLQLVAGLSDFEHLVGVLTADVKQHIARTLDRIQRHAGQKLGERVGDRARFGRDGRGWCFAATVFRH